MNKASKIIILRGNSGSGKTTVSKKLQTYFGHGTFLISQDVARREMLYVKDGPRTEAIDLLITFVKHGKENCDIVILEGILNADWYERLFHVIKEEFKSNIYAYYFDIPFEETLLRHKTKPNAIDFGEEEMKRWWREGDYLKIIDEYRITQDMTEDVIIEMMVRQINKGA